MKKPDPERAWRDRLKVDDIVVIQRVNGHKERTITQVTFAGTRVLRTKQGAVFWRNGGGER